MKKCSQHLAVSEKIFSLDELAGLFILFASDIPNPMDLKDFKKEPHRDHPGFNQFIFPITREKKFNPHQYKYLYVAAGWQATTGRLLPYLAHSGAVILLHDSEYQYHFSAALRPWVHYVPITYNGADLTEKASDRC